MDLSQCSPALNASQGITANPDISGIGVRSSIYAQAVLSLVHPFVAGYDGRIDDYERQSLATVYLGILLPGCALLFSAIIQAKTFGLSVYHGMIVLFLSWINNTSALTYFAFMIGNGGYAFPQQKVEELKKRMQVHTKMKELEDQWKAAAILEGKLDVLARAEEILDILKQDMKGARCMSHHRELLQLEIQQWDLFRMQIITTSMSSTHQEDGLTQRLQEIQRQRKKNESDLFDEINVSIGRILQYEHFPSSFWVMGALASAHLVLLSAFGLWLWCNLPNFGIDRECIPHIHLIFFTKPIPITSTVLRSSSKGLVTPPLVLITTLARGDIKFGRPPYPIPGFRRIFQIATEYFATLWSRDYPSRNQNAVPVAVDSPLPTASASQSELANDTAPSANHTPGSLRDLINDRNRSPILIYFRLFTQPFFMSSVITTLAVQIALIALTELTVARNRHLMKSKEDDWTLGQTLALMLTLIPLIEVIKFLWEKRPSTERERRERRESRNRLLRPENSA